MHEKEAGLCIILRSLPFEVGRQTTIGYLNALLSHWRWVLSCSLIY